MTISTEANLRQDYPALTALRGALACLVVLYHFQGNLLTVNIPLPALVEKGYLAVSAFFILSGFILSRVYSSRKISLWKFYQARFARIYPVYLLGVVAMAPIVWYSGKLKGLGFSEHLWELLLTIFCLQAYSSITWQKWNLVGWSLSCETLFYCLFPFLAILFKVSTKLLLLIIFAFIFLAGLCHEPNLFFYEGYFQWLHRHSPLIRLPEFCLGILIGLLPRPRLGQQSTIAFLLVILLALQLCAHFPNEPGRFTPTFLVPALWALVIIVLSSDIFKKPPVALLWMGKISYALYVTHLAAAAYSKPLARALIGDWAFLLQIPFCILIAHFTYKYLEAPARDYLISKDANKEKRMQKT